MSVTNEIRTCHGKDSVFSRRKWCSERCRRVTMYSRPCVDCGQPTDGSDGLRDEPRCRCCAPVVSGAARKVWTRQACVLAIQQWAFEYGDPPASADWNPAQCRILHDVARAQSWSRAIAAAGFTPRAPNGGGGNMARRRTVRAKAEGARP